LNGLPYFVKAGLKWAAATIAFGLLPLWLRAFGLALRPGSGFDVEGVLKEGMLVFFSMAIVSAITVDYFLSSYRYSRFVEIYTVVLFPSLVYIFTLAAYFSSTLYGADVVAQNRYMAFEILMAIVSSIYACFHKMAQYHIEGPVVHG